MKNLRKEGFLKHSVQTIRNIKIVRRTFWSLFYKIQHKKSHKSDLTQHTEFCQSLRLKKKSFLKSSVQVIRNIKEIRGTFLSPLYNIQEYKKE